MAVQAFGVKKRSYSRCLALRKDLRRCNGYRTGPGQFCSFHREFINEYDEYNGDDEYSGDDSDDSELLSNFLKLSKF
jgi:hypothetical protein